MSRPSKPGALRGKSKEPAVGLPCCTSREPPRIATLPRELTEPLLGAPGFAPGPDPVSFVPLYAVSFIRTTAFAVVSLPLLGFRSYSLVLSTGGAAPTAAVFLGVTTALRYLSEFAAANLMPLMTHRLGWRAALLASSAALTLESDLIGLAPSPAALGASHVLAGLFFSDGTVENSLIMASVPAGRGRIEAQSNMLSCFTTALVFGPMLGGCLLKRYGELAPCTCANMLTLFTIAILAWLPGDLPRCRQSIIGTARRREPVLQACVQRPWLAWCCMASWLSSCGMAMFGAVNILWMIVGLGWNAEEQGRFLALGAWVLMMTQELIMPLLLRLTRDGEWVAVKACLLCTAVRFFAFAAAPGGKRLVLALVATAPGFCSAPLLTALCLNLVQKAQQEHWAHRLVYINTSASIVGALLGAGILAAAMHASRSPALPLLAAAACYLLAIICVTCAQRSCPRHAPDSTLGCIMGLSAV